MENWEKEFEEMHNKKGDFYVGPTDVRNFIKSTLAAQRTAIAAELEERLNAYAIFEAKVMDGMKPEDAQRILLALLAVYNCEAHKGL